MDQNKCSETVEQRLERLLDSLKTAARELEAVLTAVSQHDLLQTELRLTREIRQSHESVDLRGLEMLLARSARTTKRLQTLLVGTSGMAARLKVLNDATITP